MQRFFAWKRMNRTKPVGFVTAFQDCSFTNKKPSWWMSKLLSTPNVSVVFLCAYVTLEPEIMPPPPPPPPQPESTTQNNARFNTCRRARYSIVLTVWNIRHITSCILLLPGRWLQRRIVSGVSRNLLCARHFYLLVILHWYILFVTVRTFKFESNSRNLMNMTLWISYNIFHLANVTLRLRSHV